MPDAKEKPAEGNRLAKVMARAGLCSRRDAEVWIAEGRVSVNGKQIRTPAFNVNETDKIVVDGKPLVARAGTRLWLYHKPAGLVVTEKDPEGRKTIFEALAQNGLPRFVTIGRLDINTEGLLLLTNDGGLKRVLELPATGWLRRYRVRAHGTITQAKLDTLKNGITIDGVKYGPIEAELEREQGANVWITVALREGKNREVKNVLSELGLQVNRLIRTSYGPFQLGDVPVGGVLVVRARVLRDQLGHKLAKEAGVDFDSPLPDDAPPEMAARDPNQRMRKKPEGELIRQPKPRGRTGAPKPAPVPGGKPRKNAPERKGNFEFKPRAPREEKPIEKRIVHFTDGRDPVEFELKAKRPRTDDDERGGGNFKREGAQRRVGGDDKSRSARPASRGDGDKPRGARPGGERSFGDKPRSPRSEGERSFGDRPRSPRPPRGKDDRAPSGGDRRPGGFGDKPRSARPAGNDTNRPARPPRRDGDSARPSVRPSAAPRGGKPGGKPAGRPAGPRPTGPRPSGPSAGPRKGPPRGRTPR